MFRRSRARRTRKPQQKPSGDDEDDGNNNPNPAPQPEPQPEPQPIVFTPEQSAEMERQKQAAAEKARNDGIAAGKKEAADAAKLEADKQAGNFKELFEAEQKKTAALETEVTALRDVCDSFIEDRRSKLPDHLKKLDPKHDDRAKELTWLNDAAAEAETLEAENGDKKAKPGNRTSPKPDVMTDESKRLEQTKQTLKAAGGYAKM